MEKKGLGMKKTVTLHLDNKPMRFTPDGKVSVVDAITATTHSNRARAIWETLKGRHPEVLALCEDYFFQGKDPVPVVGSTGWEAIMPLLFYYAMSED
jgi:hypothetical protein